MMHNNRNMDQLLIGLTLAACISPLLTFTHLWQLKEWRIDRLREHLRSVGWFRQLFGISRPLIIATGFLILIFNFQIPIFKQFSNSNIQTTTLIALASLSVVQIAIKKQKYPVWTSKVLTIASTSLLLTTALSFYIHYSTFSILLILLPIIQPFFLFLSWLLWNPVDRMLKRHTLEEARTLRDTYDDLTVIAITGSVGKTTTKELLSHILSDHNVIATPAYVNTEMGVAQWLIKILKPMCPSILIVEMGAYRKGEIQTLCEIVQPTIGVITYIGSQHLGLFGSREAIAQAKRELFESLPENGHAFINATTPFVEQLKEKAACPVTLVQPQIPYSSISLAMAVARHLGMNQDQIQNKINSFTPPSHTFSVRQESGVTILDDTHNVSPESFRAAIEWSASQPQTYKVLMTPGIIELGKEETAIHKQLGGQASHIFNRVIFLNKKHARMFESGYGTSVEIFSNNINSVPPNSLLVCIGRMSDPIIQNLLP